MKKATALIIACMLTAAIVFTGCGKSSTTNGNASKETGSIKKTVEPEIIKASDPSKVPQVAKNRKDSIIIGLNEISGTFNPLFTGSLYDAQAAALIFEGMISNDKQGNPIPNIAKDWTISKDGKTYTFHLNKGIKFTSGDELTADDVAFTYTCICDPSYDGSLMSNVEKLVGYKEYNDDVQKDAKGQRTSKVLNKVTSVKGIKVIDKYTIQFILSEVKANAIWDFGSGILSRKYYACKKGEVKNKCQGLYLKPMGCGPYILKNYRAAQDATYEKNPNYWRGVPKINKVVLKTTKTETLIQEMTTGVIDISQVPSLAQTVDMLKDAKFIDMHTYLSNGYDYFGFNLRKDVFKDKRVRQALTYGLDRKTAIQSYFKGYSEVCNQPMSPVSWASADKVNTYDYDKVKAGKLLDEAGWKMSKDGFRYKNGKKFTIHWLTYTDSKFVQFLIPIVKEDWKEIGVNVVVEQMEFNTLCDKVYTKREFDIYNMAWSLSIDPDPSGIFSKTQDVPNGNNCIGWRDEKSEKLMQDGMKEINQEKRKKIYNEWCKLFNEEMPYLLLDQGKDMFAISSRVSGFEPSSYIDWTMNIYKFEIKK